MKVLLISQFFPPVIGGEERHVHSLACGLKQLGHDVAVATLSQSAANAPCAAPEMKVFPLRGIMQRISGVYVDRERPHAPPFPDPELALHLKRAVADHRPDVVHAHNWICYSYLPIKRLSRAPFVLTLHDYGLVCARKDLTVDGDLCSGSAPGKCFGCSVDHYGKAKGVATWSSHMMMRPFMSHAIDHYIAVSTAVAQENRIAGLPNDVIPNFIPDRYEECRDSPKTALLPGEPFILFVGDLSSHKGVHVLLEAYRSLQNAPPLVLIGRRTPTTPQDLPPNVRLFESWAHADVLNAWRNCLFGVAPSIWREPCATVIMEGMSFGKPMIASRLGGNVDIIEHDASGLLVAPSDAADLARAMQALVDDPGLRERLGAGAATRVRGFRSSAVVPRIAEVYAKLVGRLH